MGVRSRAAPTLTAPGQCGRIFAWKLIQEGLATKCNKKKRRIIHDAICDLCGQAEETEHHAVVRCTQAATRREAMIRESWNLPPESMLAFNGPEWLSLLIDRLDTQAAAQLVLIFWRAWFIRNELTHEGRWSPIQKSITLTSLHLNVEADEKGKAPIERSTEPTRVPPGSPRAATGSKLTLMVPSQRKQEKPASE